MNQSLNNPMAQWLNGPISNVFGSTLPHAFYGRPTTEVARDLLGRVLVRRTPEGDLAGAIVETEAYGPGDLANHAARGESKRNAVMYGPPGFAYVYLIYGMHWCLNAVTMPAGCGEAVLIRALEPLAGVDTMRRHRGAEDVRLLCSGPGRLCEAMGITGELNGTDLAAGDTFIAEGAWAPRAVTTTRVGITKSAHLEWRYYVEGNRFVSRR